VIATAYTRRLLRAPATAAEDIGWPGATRAITYLQRLTATPVSPARARAAATALAEADAAASGPRPPAGPAVTAAAAPRAPLPERRHPLQPPPALVPGSGSPAPRL
jgi:hypothetical protein